MKGINITRAELVHEDERRKLLSIFNGEYNIRSVKFLHAKEGSTLGNHYHTYSEVRYLIKGKAHYYLKNLTTNEEMDFIMEEGDILTTGPNIVHTAIFLEDSVMLDCSEEPFINADYNNYPYKLK